MRTIRLCLLLSFALLTGALAQRAQAAEDLVVIHITGRGTQAKYIREGDAEQKPVHVKVGQTVRWANDRETTATHTATSSKLDSTGERIFNTGRIEVGESADCLMDRSVFERAGGPAGGSIDLEYFCLPHTANNMKSSIVLEDFEGDTKALLTGARAGRTELVRKNAASLSEVEIRSLRRGIAVMKSRPVTDRRSWRYWANIHGVTGSPGDPLWAQCEHGNIHFFTWHRAYLYFFEQTLREAAQDPNLTLPYWDWSTNRSVPLPYRVPDDPTTNSLFDERRQMNNGAMLPRSIVVSDLNTANQALAFTSFSSRLDNSPHGTVHTSVGGPDGTMTRVATSANDPIFWAHHANVDRLWNRWLGLGGGRTNPSDSGFLNRQFTLVAPDGSDVSIRVRELLDQSQLPNPYRYDDDPVAVPVRFVAHEAERPVAGESTPLGLEPSVSKVSLERESAVRVKDVLAGKWNAEQRLLIDILGISFSEVPRYTYGVYLNLPESEANEERLNLHYVGSISFFAREPLHGKGRAMPSTARPGKIVFSQTLDATEAAARLKAAGAEVGDDITVTLRPITLVPPPGKEKEMTMQNRASAESAKVAYESIRFRVGSE